MTATVRVVTKQGATRHLVLPAGVDAVEVADVLTGRAPVGAGTWKPPAWLETVEGPHIRRASIEEIAIVGEPAEGVPRSVQVKKEVPAAAKKAAAMALAGFVGGMGGLPVHIVQTLVDHAVTAASAGEPAPSRSTTRAGRAPGVSGKRSESSSVSSDIHAAYAAYYEPLSASRAAGLSAIPFPPYEPSVANAERDEVLARLRDDLGAGGDRRTFATRALAYAYRGEDGRVALEHPEYALQLLQALSTRMYQAQEDLAAGGQRRARALSEWSASPFDSHEDMLRWSASMLRLRLDASLNYAADGTLSWYDPYRPAEATRENPA